MIGRPPSCLCGYCLKCKQRVAARERWQSLTLEQRREIIADRDKEQTRKRDRERYDRHRDKRLAAIKNYDSTHKESTKARKQRWAERNPEKRKAQWAVSNALRDGKLQKGSCELAGLGGCNGRIEAHHDDYDKPLEVRWLCVRHHAEHRHKEREVYLLGPSSPGLASASP